MKVELLNLYYPSNRVKFMLSSYALKGYFDKNSFLSNKIFINVSNFPSNLNPSIIYEYLKQKNADVIGFSCYVWNIELIYKILCMFKDNEKPIIILGGPEISQNTLQNQSYNLQGDYLILGEGEVAFQNLLENLYDKLYFGNSFIRSGKVIKINTDFNNVDLSKMPLMYTDNIVPSSIYDHELIFLETQRGCKYKCKYCVYHGNIRGINYYPLDYVFKEIDYLLKEVGVTSIRIIDASFTSNLIRAKTIIKYFVSLKNQGYYIMKLLIEFNYPDCDEEFLKLIAELKKKPYIEKLRNCEVLDAIRSDSPEILDDYTVISGVGIQSFSSDALKSMSRKPIDYDELNAFFERCRILNIVLKIDIILGLPFETEKSYYLGLDTVLDFIKDTDHTLQLALLQVLPGSLLEKSVSKYGLIYSQSSPHVVLQTETMSKDSLARCTKITGLTARIINSAMRTIFFETKDFLQCSNIELIQKIYERVLDESSLKYTKYYTQYSINDDYWGGEIYTDLPSDLLYNAIQFIIATNTKLHN